MITHCKNLKNKEGFLRLFSWSSPDDIRKVAHIIAKGGVVVGSSDTVIGLLALATGEGKNTLNALKSRSKKPYVVLVSQEVLYNRATAQQKTLFEKLFSGLWPGPLTVIAPVPGFNSEAYSSSGEIAIRIPDHLGLQQLIAAVGPLFSTSANLSGEPVPHKFDQIADTVCQQIDAVIHDPKAEPGDTASTIIRLVDNGYELVRPGVVPVAQIDKAFTQ